MVASVRIELRIETIFKYLMVTSLTCVNLLIGAGREAEPWGSDSTRLLLHRRPIDGAYLCRPEMEG